MNWTMDFFYRSFLKIHQVACFEDSGQLNPRYSPNLASGSDTLRTQTTQRWTVVLDRSFIKSQFRKLAPSRTKQSSVSHRITVSFESTSIMLVRKGWRFLRSLKITSHLESVKGRRLSNKKQLMKTDCET